MQTKKQSIIESAANVISGLIISFAIQLAIFPMLGIPVTINQNFIITAIFFVASFIRGYIIRRLFNKKSKDTEMIDFVLGNYQYFLMTGNIYAWEMLKKINEKAKELKQ